MLMLSRERGVIAADTIAQLAATYVGASQVNTLAYVAGSGGYYRFAIDASLSLISDDVTIVPSTTVTDGFWVLTNIASTSSAANSADWYVSSKNGDDSNDGITPATPLKTVRELSVRLSNAGFNGAAVYVHVQDVVAMDDQLTLRRPVDAAAGPIYFYYDPITPPLSLITGSLLKVQDISRTTGTRMGIENVNHAFNWGPHVGKIVEMTSGFNTGAWGRVDAVDTDPLKPYVAVTSAFAIQGTPTATSPDVTSVISLDDGDFKMYDRPSFPDTMIIDIPGQVWFQDFDFQAGSGVQSFQSGQVVFIRCTSNGARLWSTSIGGTYFSFQGAYFNDAAIYNHGGGCVYNASSITTPPEAKILQLQGDTELLDLTDPIRAMDNGGVLYLKDVAVGNLEIVGGSIVAGANSTIAIEGYVYGRDIGGDGDEPLIRMSSWSKGYYTDPAKLTASTKNSGNVAGSAKVDFQNASGEKLFSALPFVANATASETQAGFIAKV